MAGMFELMGLSGRHRFLSTLPLYTSGGRNSCVAHLLRGDCVVLYPSLVSPAEYVDLVTCSNYSCRRSPVVCPEVARNRWAPSRCSQG